MTKVNVGLHTFHSETLHSVVDKAIEFFEQTPSYSLPPPSDFVGGGVYALYYFGRFEHYTKLSVLDRDECKQPIYVGKAVPPGWRTGRQSTTESSELYRRLNEHARSISQSKNLLSEDFRCRFMILNNAEGDLIVPVEADLIRTFKPLWNSGISGFGIHPTGGPRSGQARSEWDMVHPGRPFAEKLPATRDIQDIIKKINSHLSTL